ncbi:MAG: S8 family serine peptidase, partial [Rhodothermales bacterium]
LIDEMKRDPDIKWVEPDIYMGRVLIPLATETGNGSQLMPWGTARIGATGKSAAGVDLFVIDTGVSNNDVNVTESIDLRAGTNEPADYDGHGTHIAGLAGAIDDEDGLLGVAPGVNIRSLKVLNGDESSEGDQVEMAAVIAAVEYVTGEKLANPNKPMVVNLSLGADVGTSKYNALDDAITASIENGVTYVISAGNQGIDVKNVTPAHVKKAITVGAYDVFDRFASFSNYGKEVDILAPGTDLISLIHASDQSDFDFIKMSGTSMAAGYVSGAVALFLADNPNANPKQVAKALDESGASVILNTPGSTTNKSVAVSSLMNTQLPPFFEYAIFAGKDLKLYDGLQVFAEEGALKNASVFSNRRLSIYGRQTKIEGFGYYKSKISGKYASAFHPPYNPTDLTPYRKVDDIKVPKFKASDHKKAATKTTTGNLKLSGHYTLGTRENPEIWYVSGNLKIVDEVTISGYGVFLVNGKIQIYDNLRTVSGTEETTLGLYSSGNINSYASDLAISAQVFSGSRIEILDNTTIYGNITATANINFYDNVTVHYRAALPILTDPIWPNQ